MTSEGHSAYNPAAAAWHPQHGWVAMYKVVSCFCAALCTRKCSERQTNPQPVLTRLGTDPSRMDLGTAAERAVQLRYDEASYRPMLREASGASGFVAADYRPFWLGDRLLVSHWVKLFYDTSGGAAAAAGGSSGGGKAQEEKAEDEGGAADALLERLWQEQRRRRKELHGGGGGGGRTLLGDSGQAQGAGWHARGLLVRGRPGVAGHGVRTSGRTNADKIRKQLRDALLPGHGHAQAASAARAAERVAQHKRVWDKRQAARPAGAARALHGWFELATEPVRQGSPQGEGQARGSGAGARPAVRHPLFPRHPAAGRECLFLAGHSCEFSAVSEVDLEAGTMRLVHFFHRPPQHLARGKSHARSLLQTEHQNSDLRSYLASDLLLGPGQRRLLQPTVAEKSKAHEDWVRFQAEREKKVKEQKQNWLQGMEWKKREADLFLAKQAAEKAAAKAARSQPSPPPPASPSQQAQLQQQGPLVINCSQHHFHKHHRIANGSFQPVHTHTHANDHSGNPSHERPAVDPGHPHPDQEELDLLYELSCLPGVSPGTAGGVRMHTEQAVPEYRGPEPEGAAEPHHAHQHHGRRAHLSGPGLEQRQGPRHHYALPSRGTDRQGPESQTAAGDGGARHPAALAAAAGLWWRRGLQQFTVAEKNRAHEAWGQHVEERQRGGREWRKRRQEELEATKREFDLKTQQDSWVKAALKFPDPQEGQQQQATGGAARPTRHHRPRRGVRSKGSRPGGGQGTQGGQDHADYDLVDPYAGGPTAGERLLLLRRRLGAASEAAEAFADVVGVEGQRGAWVQAVGRQAAAAWMPQQQGLRGQAGGQADTVEEEGNNEAQGKVGVLRRDDDANGEERRGAGHAAAVARQPSVPLRPSHSAAAVGGDAAESEAFVGRHLLAISAAAQLREKYELMERRAAARLEKAKMQKQWWLKKQLTAEADVRELDAQKQQLAGRRAAQRRQLLLEQQQGQGGRQQGEGQGRQQQGDKQGIVSWEHQQGQGLQQQARALQGVAGQQQGPGGQQQGQGEQQRGRTSLGQVGPDSSAAARRRVGATAIVLRLQRTRVQRLHDGGGGGGAASSVSWGKIAQGQPTMLRIGPLQWQQWQAAQPQLPGREKNWAFLDPGVLPHGSRPAGLGTSRGQQGEEEGAAGRAATALVFYSLLPCTRVFSVDLGHSGGSDSGTQPAFSVQHCYDMASLPASIPPTAKTFHNSGHPQVWDLTRETAATAAAGPEPAGWAPYAGQTWLLAMFHNVGRAKQQGPTHSHARVYRYWLALLDPVSLAIAAVSEQPVLDPSMCKIKGPLPHVMFVGSFQIMQVGAPAGATAARGRAGKGQRHGWQLSWQAERSEGGTNQRSSDSDSVGSGRSWDLQDGVHQQHQHVGKTVSGLLRGKSDGAAAAPRATVGPDGQGMRPRRRWLRVFFGEGDQFASWLDVELDEVQWVATKSG